MIDLLHACKYANNVYIGAPKNGLISHLTFLHKNGWISGNMNIIAQEENSDQYSYWGHIRNPHKRHTKGIAEFLDRKYILEGGSEYVIELFKKNEEMANLAINGLYDEHTYPLALSLHPNIKKVLWIPLDTEMKSEVLTNQHMKDLNLNCKIKNRLNVSRPFHVKLQKLINEIKDQNQVYKSFFTNVILEKDIILYNNAINFWSHKMNSPEMLKSLI